MNLMLGCMNLMLIQLPQSRKPRSNSQVKFAIIFDRTLLRNRPIKIKGEYCLNVRPRFTV